MRLALTHTRPEHHPNAWYTELKICSWLRVTVGHRGGELMPGRRAGNLYSPSCREGVFSKTQGLEGMRRGPGRRSPGPFLLTALGSWVRHPTLQRSRPQQVTVVAVGVLHRVVRVVVEPVVGTRVVTAQLGAGLGLGLAHELLLDLLRRDPRVLIDKQRRRSGHMRRGHARAGHQRVATVLVGGLDARAGSRDQMAPVFGGCCSGAGGAVVAGVTGRIVAVGGALRTGVLAPRHAVVISFVGDGEDLLVSSRAGSAE